MGWKGARKMERDGVGDGVERKRNEKMFWEEMSWKREVRER